MFKVLTSAGFASEEIERFRIEFQRSGRYSVDAFLQNRADLSSLGRAIIAYQIMIKERHEALYESSADADWYRHLASDNKLLTFEQLNGYEASAMRSGCLWAAE